MLLLITDESLAQEKKEVYIDLLPVDGIITTNSIDEARKIVVDNAKVDIVVINNVLIEDIPVTNDDLKKLSFNFSGIIILKVANDIEGVKLIKAGLISDYYVSSENKDVELARLKEAFNQANNQKMLVCNLNSCYQALNELKKATNGRVNV